MVSKLIFEISTFKWGGTTALDPNRIDRRGYHVYFFMCLNIHVFFYILGSFLNFLLINRDLSRILCLFITTAIFTGRECFWWVLNVGNTVILTGLTYTSSRNVFQDILANSGVKKSIMGRSSVGKIDE